MAKHTLFRRSLTRPRPAIAFHGRCPGCGEIALIRFNVDSVPLTGRFEPMRSCGAAVCDRCAEVADHGTEAERMVIAERIAKHQGMGRAA